MNALPRSTQLLQSVAMVAAFGSVPAPQVVHCRPSFEYCPTHASQPVRGALGSFPASHREQGPPSELCQNESPKEAQLSHDVRSVLGWFPALHCTHWTVDEYFPAAQASHIVWFREGPLPAEHGVQLVRSLETTLGGVQSWHAPKIEYWIPVQSSHPDRLALGPWPGSHCMQPIAPSPSVFVTCGAWHTSHEGAPAFAYRPVGHVVHSVSVNSRAVPASHGMQKKRWSCVKADPPWGPLRPAGHNSHIDIKWRVSVVWRGHG
jgi:hypothetical protein